MNATGRKETNENVATPRAVVKRLVVVDQRFVNDAPVNPATSVPMAIKLASNIGQPAKTYELKEPAKTAGQIQFPCKRMTAKAKPLGGQTSVVTAFGENDRATWTSPKKSAAIEKTAMTEKCSAFDAANRLNLFLVDPCVCHYRVLRRGRQKARRTFTHVSQHLAAVWPKCANQPNHSTEIAGTLFGCLLSR